ncbi:Casp9p [Branchiostoma belcheri]|nr:Casp9p [Branchiostoma belcheri]
MRRPRAFLRGAGGRAANTPSRRVTGTYEGQIEDIKKAVGQSCQHHREILEAYDALQSSSMEVARSAPIGVIASVKGDFRASVKGEFRRLPKSPEIVSSECRRHLTLIGLTAHLAFGRLNTRTGTDVDCSNLTRLLTFLNFDVKVENNKSAASWCGGADINTDEHLLPVKEITAFFNKAVTARLESANQSCSSCRLAEEVNNKVATRFQSAGKNKQMPAPVTMLRRKLFFNPGHAAVLCDRTVTAMLFDGTVTAVLCDRTVKAVLCDGTVTAVLHVCDGTVKAVLCDGTVTAALCDGTVTAVLCDRTVQQCCVTGQ